ncbi:MAG: LysR family transcriptional regulator substrate-binding protein, partial [Angelakisella sp.]
LPIHDSGVQSYHCFAIHDVFVASSSYPCDFQRSYTLAELAAMRLILLERKSNSRVVTEEFFLRQGVQLVPEIELGSYDMVLALTRIGLGVSCVIREFAQNELSSGELREITLSPAIPPRSIGAFSLKNVSVSPACARFLELVGCLENQKGTDES